MRTSPLSISEAQQEKEKLESKITALLSDFAKQTGTTINNVNVTINTIVGLDTLHQDFKVYVEAVL